MNKIYLFLGIFFLIGCYGVLATSCHLNTGSATAEATIRSDNTGYIWMFGYDGESLQAPITKKFLAQSAYIGTGSFYDGVNSHDVKFLVGRLTIWNSKISGIKIVPINTPDNLIFFSNNYYFQDGSADFSSWYC